MIMEGATRDTRAARAGFPRFAADPVSTGLRGGRCGEGPGVLKSPLVTRRPARLLLLLCAAAAALTGCSDSGASPQTLPPLTSSPTASATPTPTPSATDLRRSAEQFVRTYLREFDRASHASDPSVLDDFYGPACRPCKYNIDVLKRDNAKRQHVEGNEFELFKLDVSQMSGNTMAATIQVRSKAGRLVRDADGSTVKRLPASKPVRTDLIIARLDGRWQIVDIVPLGEVNS
jgi:hypothetical protein